MNLVRELRIWLPLRCAVLTSTDSSACRPQSARYCAMTIGPRGTGRILATLRSRRSTSPRSWRGRCQPNPGRTRAGASRRIGNTSARKYGLATMAVPRLLRSTAGLSHTSSYGIRPSTRPDGPQLRGLRRGRAPRRGRHTTSRRADRHAATSCSPSRSETNCVAASPPIPHAATTT